MEKNEGIFIEKQIIKDNKYLDDINEKLHFLHQPP